MAIGKPAACLFLTAMAITPLSGGGVPIPVSEAATPWAAVARRFIGRVEQMSQAPKGEQPGFDVAAVVLSADAAKVYATAVGLLHKNQTVRVVAEDAVHRTIEFSDGTRSAGITVTDLGARLSQSWWVPHRWRGRRPQQCGSWMGS